MAAAAKECQDVVKLRTYWLAHDVVIRAELSCATARCSTESYNWRTAGRPSDHVHGGHYLQANARMRTSLMATALSLVEIRAQPAAVSRLLKT
jgi:hypothetical protein